MKGLLSSPPQGVVTHRLRTTSPSRVLFRKTVLSLLGVPILNNRFLGIPRWCLDDISRISTLSKMCSHRPFYQLSMRHFLSNVVRCDCKMLPLPCFLRNFLQFILLCCYTMEAKGSAETVVSALLLVSEMAVVDEEGFKTVNCGAIR